MSEKLSTAGKMVVLFSVTIILFAGMSALAGASDPVEKDLEDLQVKIDTTDRLVISVDKEGRNLYTVNYSELRVDTADGYDNHSVDLGEVDWDRSIEDNSDARFPHMKIVLSADLEDKGVSLGHLEINLDVISYKDTSELTFSYVLEDLNVPAGGNLIFLQEVKTGGYSMLAPEETDNSDKLNSYRFDFQSGERGYYSWKKETSVNGESSKSNYVTLKDGTRLVISSEFDSDDNKVSISPLDIEETRTGAQVPVPEPYDRVPSFVIGVAIGGGMAVGMLHKKRREFYQKKEGWETVSLEESSYYRGDK